MLRPFFITIVRENLANRGESPQIAVNTCPIRAAFGIFLTDSLLISLLSCSMFKCYFANRNEFLLDSSRIEQIPPNIRKDILSESGLTRRTSRLEKKK